MADSFSNISERLAALAAKRKEFKAKRAARAKVREQNAAKRVAAANGRNAPRVAAENANAKQKQEEVQDGQ